MDLKSNIRAILNEDALKPRKPPGRVSTHMKLLIDVPVLDYRGQVIKDAIDTEGYTLRSVLIRSALYVDTDKNPPAETKFKGYQLATKITAVPPGGFAEFSIEELATLKTSIGIMWMPWVVGVAWTALEKALPADPPVEQPPQAASPAGLVTPAVAA